MRLKWVLLLTLLPFIALKSDEKNNQSGANLLKDIAEIDTPQKARNITVDLNYENEELVSIINQIAKLKKLNLLIPENVPLSDKVTIKLGKKSINEAWNYLQLTLEKLGYSITQKNSNTYTITPLKNINREPLPIYINIPHDGLPNSEDRIRYLYYFKNINISRKGNNQSRTNIENMLKDFLPITSDNNYWFDETTNSLLISNKASMVKDIMKILGEFDSTGFRETVLVLPLYNANAKIVSTILNKLIPEKESPYQFGAQQPQQPKFGYYFSENTKISSIERTNSVVILGNMESVARVRDFIAKYLDKPLDSGSSVLHVKPLNYIDAHEIQPILQSIVKSETGPTQSVTQQELKDTLSKVIIVAEKEQPASMLEQMQSTQVGQNQTVTPQAPIVGGNNLVIAAQTEDWKVLERVIDELDIPQLQVALEVLVVDVSISDTKLLGGQTRDVAAAAQRFNWQAAHLVKPWLNFIPPEGSGGLPPPAGSINTTRGLAADLLQMTQRGSIGLPGNASEIVNVATLAQAGSTIISFNDGNGISNILQIFDQYSNATLLSQPFVTTQNHHIAKISISENRLVPGAVQQQSTGGPVVLPKDTIPAALVVQMIPRVSKTNNINLEVTVTADDFVSSNTDNNTINNRVVITNANIGNNEVLVLGGLTKKTTTNSRLSTPLLSDIPILGYFFKRKSRQSEKSSLMIFIQPTIIKPRIGGGMDPYTQKKLEYVQQKECNFEEEVEGANFENLKDPITRFFFSNPPIANKTNKEIENFGKTGIFDVSDYDTCCNLTENYKYNRGNPDACSCKAEQLKNLIHDSENPLCDHPCN